MVPKISTWYTKSVPIWKEAVEVGKEGNYGLGGVVLVGASRAWPCRTHHGLHNGILPEANREKVRE